jgi:electron transfer flavoprotein beta subunit
VTCEKGLCEMRYPSLPNLMKAKRKPVKQMTAADVAGFAEVATGVGGSKMHQFAPPPARPPGKILKGETDETVKELVRLLREEAKVI